MDTTMDENNNPFKKDDSKEQNDINENITDENQNSENIEQDNENINEDTQDETSNDDEEYKIKLEELNNKYIRLAADFDNFRKRTIQEKEDLSKYANADLLKKLITVLDTFDRAQEHLKNIDNCQTVKESYEVVFKQLSETLKKVGLEEISALGEAFNPNEHEAITQVATDKFEPDTVAFVAQKGYRLADKVLRPAMVGVASKKENEENE